MDSLTAENFSEFFETLWGRNPFAWQKSLAEKVMQNNDSAWPEAIDLPTASGKTACMDIAVFALASQSVRISSGQPLSAPRRIFFVVDRRVIVDEAYERSLELSYKLRSARFGILKHVADCLRELAAGEDPLACYQLRGGLFKSDEWARSPIQPTIIAATVDQIGSRLLFRTYGRNFKAWPIQAGLVGNDSLILLDEAHCAQPFLETLQSVCKYRTWAETPLSPPFHVVVMSATPPKGLIDVFRDESSEPLNSDHPLGARQKASKPANLILLNEKGQILDKEIRDKKKELKKAEGEKASRKKISEIKRQIRELEMAASKDLSERLSEMAETLVGKQPQAVVIFTNRVDTAKRVHNLLSGVYGDNAILLTGRMRPIDKDDIVKKKLVPLAASASIDRRLDKPIIVVATQTLEVGANLDFDILITECASLDALRQRFGRLNRMGRKINAKAAILIRAGQDKSSDDDPVYGQALANTWMWLIKQGSKKLQIDMGIHALSKTLPTGEEIEALNAPSSHAPVMLPAHVDCWVQTSPEPKPTPDIALFLHGPKSGPADIQVCWRADLIGPDVDAWKEAVALCPPSAPECLSVPFGLMRNWLIGGPMLVDETDVEGVLNSEPMDSKTFTALRQVVRWRGRNDILVTRNPEDILPGDVIVIPADLRGWETLAALETLEPISDLGDRAYAQSRNKALLRIHPHVIKQIPQTESLKRLSDVGVSAEELFEEDRDRLVENLKAALQDVAYDTLTPNWLREIAGNLISDKGLSKRLMSHPTGGLVVRGNRRLSKQSQNGDGFSEEDDDLSSGTVRVELSDHLDGVASHVDGFSRHCVLPDDLKNILKLTGKVHDFGKADPRFQAWIKGGNLWFIGLLLAKSDDMVKSPKAIEQTRVRAGYPKGGRHELLSVRLLERANNLLPQNEDFRELLLHLVESHHGHCRPFAPVVPDDSPVDVTLEHQGRKLSANSNTNLEMLDSGVAERFWKLTRRYGWWGLAWLEAIFRLADHRRSEWEQEKDRGIDNG